MTVSTEQSRNSYTGDGANDTFAYEFKIFTKTDLKVYVDDVLQTVDVNYTVTPAESEMPADSGGNVVFGGSYVPGVSAEVVIQRVLEYTQEYDLEESGVISAETMEATLDKIVMLVQQVKNDLDAVIAETYTPPVAVSNGGTGAVTAAEAIINLGIQDNLTYLFIDNDVGVEYDHFGLAPVTSVLRVHAAPLDSYNEKFFVAAFECLVGTEGHDDVPGFDHKVAMFAGTRRNSNRTDEIWGANILAEAETGAGVYSCIGMEIDIGHNDLVNGSCTVDTADNLDGLHVNASSNDSLDCFRGILVGGVGSRWIWGIHIPDTTVVDCGILIDSGHGGSISGAIKAAQLEDGAWGINVRRQTDSSPTGYLYSATNAAVDSYLFAISASDPGSNCTPLFLKVASESGVLQVKVDADDSAGSGKRHVYIDNAA
jgi:hypothetical protein